MLQFFCFLLGTYLSRLMLTIILLDRRLAAVSTRQHLPIQTVDLKHCVLLHQTNHFLQFSTNFYKTKKQSLQLFCYLNPNKHFGTDKAGHGLDGTGQPPGCPTLLVDGVASASDSKGAEVASGDVGITAKFELCKIQPF